MFGIDDILIGAAIGGAMGGLTNRKKPLQGALMGAGLGGLGGGLAPAGLLGSSAAPGMAGATGSGITAGTTGAVAGMDGALGGGLSMGGTGLGMSGGIGGGIAAPSGVGLSGGLGGGATGGLLGDTMGLVKNAGTVMNAAGQAKQLANQEERPIQPAPIATPMPNNNLGQMVSSYEQQQIARQQMEQQKWLARRKLYGYGVA